MIGGTTEDAYNMEEQRIRVQCHDVCSFSYHSFFLRVGTLVMSHTHLVRTSGHVLLRVEVRC